jgi:hypothetical protein
MIEYPKYMQSELIEHQSISSKLFDEIISGKWYGCKEQWTT